MQVVATRLGHDGQMLRKPGDVFDVPDDADAGEASWFKPLPKGKAQAKEAIEAAKEAADEAEALATAQTKAALEAHAAAQVAANQAAQSSGAPPATAG